MTAPLSNTQRAPDLRFAGRFTWEEFDTLPRLLRDLINYTPHAVASSRVARQLRDGIPLAVVARQAHARWSRYARLETLALYGPTHPQCESARAA